MTNRRQLLFTLLVPPGPGSPLRPPVQELTDAQFLNGWWAARKAWPGAPSHQLVAQKSEQESAPAFRGTPGHHPKTLPPRWRQASGHIPWPDDQTPYPQRIDVTRTRSRVLATAALALAMLTVGTAAPATAATGDPDGTMTPMIVGGQPASQLYRGLGSLQYQRGDNPNFHECGVLLWDARHAITNAHCITEYPTPTLEDPRSFHIRFNSNDRLAGGIQTGVWKTAVYPSWDWGAGTDLQGDIAVLWLTKPVYTMPNIMTPMAGLKRIPFGPARIAGWGYTSYPWDQPDAPQQLSELDTAIVDPSHCAAAVIDVGEVCVADPNNPSTAACFGDSGGPVMVRAPHLRSYWYLVGTASRETAVACAGPVVYTSVLYYRDWINKTINGTYQAPKPRKSPAATASRPALRWAGCGTGC